MLLRATGRGDSGSKPSKSLVEPHRARPAALDRRQSNNHLAVPNGRPRLGRHAARLGGDRAIRQRRDTPTSLQITVPEHHSDQRWRLRSTLRRRWRQTLFFIFLCRSVPADRHRSRVNVQHLHAQVIGEQEDISGRRS